MSDPMPTQPLPMPPYGDENAMKRIARLEVALAGERDVIKTAASELMKISRLASLNDMSDKVRGVGELLMVHLEENRPVQSQEQ